LKLAIKRAIVQLALEKESHLKEELINIDYSSGGSLLISSIDENVKITIKAKVLGLHIASDNDDQLKIFVWVSRS